MNVGTLVGRRRGRWAALVLAAYAGTARNSIVALLHFGCGQSQAYTSRRRLAGCITSYFAQAELKRNVKARKSEVPPASISPTRLTGDDSCRACFDLWIQ